MTLWPKMVGFSISHRRSLEVALQVR